MKFKIVLYSCLVSFQSLLDCYLMENCSEKLLLSLKLSYTGIKNLGRKIKVNRITIKVVILKTLSFILAVDPDVS